MKNFVLAAALLVGTSFSALADTTSLSSPGLTLTSPGDEITRVNVSYDTALGAAGPVTGTFHVVGTTGPARNVSARFANAAAAYNYASAVNDAAGGYSVTNYGTGLVVKNSPKTIKALPVGVDGIVVQNNVAVRVGDGVYGHGIARTVYHSDGSCTGACGLNNQAPDTNPAPDAVAKVSMSKGGIGVKGGGGANYGHATRSGGF